MRLYTRCLFARSPLSRVWPVLLLGLSSGLALAVPQCELNGESVSPSNGHTTAGKSGVMRCTDDSGPVRLREQTLRDGRFEGPVRFVMASGERREYSVNARGNRDGVVREWDARGTLRREENLDNGQAIGEQRAYAVSGRLQRLDYVVNRRVALSISYLEDGSISALRCAPVSLLPQDRLLCGHDGSASNVTLYREPGQVSGTVSLLAGALVRQTLVNEQGGLVRSEEVKRSPGETDRRIKRVYYPSGQLRSETDLLQRDPDVLVREGVVREWAESGQLTQQTVWVAGREQRIEQWYLNGQRKFVQTIKREGRNEQRDTTSYWDTGERAAENAERNGRLFGWQRYFSETGVLQREDEHGPRGVLLRRKSYKGQGVLDKEERFLEDGSRI
jgi:antitoxin component YwqK of YwqJK toxin-antitoxin module